MSLIEKILLSVHLVAGAVWVGAVFMGAFIDWPSAKNSVKAGTFPFKFIIGHGKRVFYSVYFGILQLWATGTALYFIHPPENATESTLLLLKTLFLSLMTLFTLYGTFFTWPKIQLATNEEAFKLHKYYNLRAYGTFTFGVLGLLTTLWFYIYKV